MENKIKRFLSTNLLWKAVALALAILFWLILSNVQDPIVDRNVNVTISYDESYLDSHNYIATSKPTTVTIPIRVRRSNVSRVKSEDFTVSIDTSQYLGGSVKIAPESTKFMMTITKNPSANYIEDWEYPKSTGRYVDVIVDTVKTATYRIQFNLIGELPQELQALEPIANPARVKVTGPTSDFANLVSVKATVDLSKITAQNNSLMADLQLYDGNNSLITNKNLVLSQESVEVTVETAQTKEVGLTVSTMGEPQSGFGCRKFDYNPKTIFVTGSEEAIAAMQSANIVIPKAAVDITGLSATKVFKIKIEDYLPSGLTVADGQPDEVEVTCEIERLEERSFTINTDIFKFMGTDDRYRYEIVSPTTEIVLRSFADVLEDFPQTGGNLQGTINVYGMGPSDSTSFATVMISIDRQYSLVNDIQVEIRITPVKEEEQETSFESGSEEDATEATSGDAASSSADGTKDEQQTEQATSAEQGTETEESKTAAE